MLGNYFRKMIGTTQSPPRVSIVEILWSWLGAFLGITTVAYLNYFILDKTELMMIIGSFGASAVLIYGAIKSPLAQPRNLLGGHVISALIGVTCLKILDPYLWLAAPLAVATSIAVMHATKTLHPARHRPHSHSDRWPTWEPLCRDTRRSGALICWRWLLVKQLGPQRRHQILQNLIILFTNALRGCRDHYLVYGFLKEGVVSKFFPMRGQPVSSMLPNSSHT
jgi:hypothetical protein